MNESCKSMPFVKCLASSGVPSQTSRMSKAEYAVTSCPPGLEHPWSKWSMSTCSWCCATMAQHKEGGWRARDERVRKRSGRREGRMRSTHDSAIPRQVVTYLLTYLWLELRRLPPIMGFVGGQGARQGAVVTLLA